MLTVPDKREQPRVAFGVLVESGLVPPGTRLTDAKRRWIAAVRVDGSIGCDTLAGSIHKVGAALQNAPSCNGWTFWHVEEGGALKPLDAFRQEHLASLRA
jgi:modification methylase